MATDTVEVRFAQIESRLTIVEERLTDLRKEVGYLRADIADIRKDIRQVLLFVLGTWVTMFLTFVLAWINLSGQIAGLRPH